MAPYYVASCAIMKIINSSSNQVNQLLLLSLLKLLLKNYPLLLYFLMNYLLPQNELRVILLSTKSTETRAERKNMMYQFYRNQLNIMLAVLPKSTYFLCLRIGSLKYQKRVKIMLREIEQAVGYTTSEGKQQTKVEDEQGTVISRISGGISRRTRNLYKSSKAEKRINWSNVVTGRCCIRGYLCVEGWRLYERPP